MVAKKKSTAVQTVLTDLLYPGFQTTVSQVPWKGLRQDEERKEKEEVDGEGGK